MRHNTPKSVINTGILTYTTPANSTGTDISTGIVYINRGTEANIEIEKTTSTPGPLYQGDTARFTVRIRNTTNVDVPNIIFSDQWPSSQIAFD